MDCILMECKVKQDSEEILERVAKRAVLRLHLHKRVKRERDVGSNVN